MHSKYIFVNYYIIIFWNNFNKLLFFSKIILVKLNFVLKLNLLFDLFEEIFLL